MFPFSVIHPTVRTPVVTVAIIVLNFAAMLWMSRLPEAVQERIVVERGFVPARIRQLSNPQLVVHVAIDRRVVVPQLRQIAIEPHEYLLPPSRSAVYASLFTTLFLHGGWMHLLGNMWFLWLFGDCIEDRLGHVLFAAFYLVGGLIATACHWAYEPESTVPVIGASGAIAAVLGAYAVTFPFARVRTLVFLLVFVTVVELPALAVLGFWFLSQLLEALGAMRLGIGGGEAGIAFWAHVGGFVSGMILMPLISHAPPPPEQVEWHEEPNRDFQ